MASGVSRDLHAIYIIVAVTDKDLVSRHFVPLCAVQNLVPNPFHILEQNLLPAAVVKFCSAAVGVAGDSLGGLQRSAVL